MSSIEFLALAAWLRAQPHMAEADAPRPPPAPRHHGSWHSLGASAPCLLVAAALAPAATARRSRRRATRAMTVEGTQIWALLGLRGTASKAEIKQRFKKFVRTNHPDVKGDRSEEAIERWANITEPLGGG